MEKTRAPFACGLLLTAGILAASACVIKTGPPPEQAPAQAAATTAPTATAAPTPSAPAPAPAPSPTTTATASADAGKFDSCAGKKCGDRCNICPPHTPGCFETALVKMCHPDGLCKPATAVDCSKSGGK